MAKRNEKITVGWREWVSFPNHNQLILKAKIDTGARTSSIHATWVREVVIEDIPHLQFTISPPKFSNQGKQKICLPLIDKRKIKNSFGKTEIRYVVRMKVKMGSKLFNTEFTLAKRSGMVFQVLIGRKALRKRFIVDPHRSFLTGKPL